MFIPVEIIGKSLGLDYEREATSDIFGTWIYVITSLWIYFKIRQSGISWSRLFGPSAMRMDYRGAGVILILTAALVAIGIGLGSIYVWLILAKTDLHFLKEMAFDFYHFGTTPFDIFFIALIGPILEEILFRGVILHRFAYRMGRWNAILLSSLIFGLLHVDTPGGFLFSVVLCMLYIKTRSLVYPIFIHVINNTAAIVLMLFEDADTFETIPAMAEGLQANLHYFAVSLGVGVVLLVASTRLFWPPKGWVLPYEALRS